MVGFKILFSVIAFTLAVCKVSRASVWVVQSDLGPDVADKNSHETLLKELSKKEVGELSYHFLTEHWVIGGGNDFYGLGSVGGVNEDQHAQAKALVTLQEKPHAFNKVFEVVKEATKYAAEQVKSSGNVKNAMAVVYEKAESLLKNEPELYNEYTALKDEAQKHTSAANHVVYYGLVPATHQDAKKILYEAASHPLNKRTLANTGFFNQTYGASAGPETVVLAKAVLEVASVPEKRNAVDAVYQAALYEAAKNVKDLSAESPDYHFDQYVKNLVTELTKTLEAKLKADPTLSADVEAAKKKFSS